jgi:predicted secreted protein
LKPKYDYKSASYLWLNSQQPVCTISQTPGKVVLIDDTMDNAVICTTVNNSITLRLGSYSRVGASWVISNSSGLLVSPEGYNFPEYAGIGTISWNVTTTAPGVQTLKAECKQYIRGDSIIDSQNLTFVVR